ncbi:MAG: helix-turn-helix transcriptional regulator, partial [Kiritimatiellaeota bacterium]|nr:helix-turn-helix transcriptional regulator [Kiritimatiellota bacterium]
KHLGQSVHNEITQMRVERAKQLLATTTLKAQEVAQQCGFGDVSYFSRCFHGLTGLRPSHYRRKAKGSGSL